MNERLKYVTVVRRPYEGGFSKMRQYVRSPTHKAKTLFNK